MPVTPLDSDEATVRCPTCGANQSWSDTCRRCKCDLALLRSAAEMCRRTRETALVHLREGRLSEALREARQLHDMCPNERSTRLLTVCHLLCGEWAEAMAVAERRHREIRPR